MTTFITILFIIVLLGATLAALIFFFEGVKWLLESMHDRNIQGSLLIISAFLLCVPIVVGTLGCLAFQIIGWGC